MSAIVVCEVVVVRGVHGHMLVVDVWFDCMVLNSVMFLDMMDGVVFFDMVNCMMMHIDWLFEVVFVYNRWTIMMNIVVMVIAFRVVHFVMITIRVVPPDVVMLTITVRVVSLIKVLVTIGVVPVVRMVVTIRVVLGVLMMISISI